MYTAPMSEKRKFIWVSMYLERKYIRHTIFSNYRRDRHFSRSSGPREGWVLVRPQESNPRPPLCSQARTLLTELI